MNMWWKHILKHWIAFATLFIITASLSLADPEDLLDQLALSASEQEAQPIIAKLWSEWSSAHSSNAEGSLMQRGIIAMNQGRIDDADVLFGRLIFLNPDFTEAWNKRATLRFIKGDYAGSEADIYEVLIRQPRHFGALSGLGLINMKLGEWRKAVNAYESLLGVYPHSPDAKTYLPALKRKLGEMEL